MPLPVIPPDPVPSEEDLRKFLDDASTLLPEPVRIESAISAWKREKKKRDENAFLVPYKPTGYDVYGSGWPRIKKRVLRTANYECACCDAPATEVHHRDYRPRVLSGEDLTPLVAICRKCHEKVEEMKGKESWNKAEELLAQLVATKETG